MTSYTVHARAFHPDKTFGPGGMYFSADDRGFTYDMGVTSRIRAYWVFNLLSLNITDRDVDSDPSHNSITGQTENYTDPDKKPTGNASFQSSPFAANGMQTAKLQWRFKGINHAFTPSESINNFVVPELNLEGSLNFVIDRHENERSMQISSTLQGDGFPNSEIFILDNAGMPVMLNTHHRFGYAAGQLGGDRRHLLGGTVITVALNADGNFIGPIKATRCVDFIPEARDLLIKNEGFWFWEEDTYSTEHSLTSWNELHTKRDASEKTIFGTDTDNDLPIPSVPIISPPEKPDGQEWNDWDDPFTAPGPEDLEDWDH